MPNMVKIEPNPNYPKQFPTTAEKKAAMELLEKARQDHTPRRAELPEIAAKEAIMNSGGLYRLVVAEPSTVAPVATRLEDLTLAQLKVAIVAQGITLNKRITKTEAIRILNQKTADIVEDPVEDPAE